MLTLEIDGVQIEAKEGSMIIEAAEAAGIFIPRFCYHKKLSIAANCRMCLVEAEGIHKPIPACATPVRDKMRVFTKSALAVAAQQGTMEFLLLNHPLDCPVCDQGGECELQDVAVSCGKDQSRYREVKHAVPQKDIGPLVATDLSRCIHCTRCVRFTEEISGVQELGMIGRGNHSEIATFRHEVLNSELSGNVIDLCPVGALTSKPFRFSARAWELKQYPALSPHDCVGTNLYVHVQHQRVMRVVPRENESINEVWISDRDRFSYAGLYSPDRLLSPKVKVDGVWQDMGWEDALVHVRQRLTGIISEKGVDSLGGMIAGNVATEELYLFQKVLRDLGVANIDHRIRQVDFRNDAGSPLFPSLGCKISDLETLDVVLLVGSDLHRDQPILAHRLRKAALKGCQIFVLNPVDFDFRFPVSGKAILAPDKIAEFCLALSKMSVGTEGKVPDPFAQLAERIVPDEFSRQVVTVLQRGEKSAVLMGNLAEGFETYSLLAFALKSLAQATHSYYGTLISSSNGVGAWLAGAVPHRSIGGKPVESVGLNAFQMVQKPRSAYVLWGIELEKESAEINTALAALGSADFVVVATAFETDKMLEYADVMLPLAIFAETEGSWVNIEGTWQSVCPAVRPQGESKVGWRVLSALAQKFGLDGFQYRNIAEVQAEISQRCYEVSSVTDQGQAVWLDSEPPSLCQSLNGVARIGCWPIYGTDSLVRRASPLSIVREPQGTKDFSVHTITAAKLSLSHGDRVWVTQGSCRVDGYVRIDDRVAENCVHIPFTGQSEGFTGTAFGAVELVPHAG